MWDALARVPMLLAPTAAGKTAAVLRWAERWPLEVVSADAMQVYRGLTIGTASPTEEERAKTAHHLVGVVDPATPYSVVEYVRAAEAAITEVVGRSRVPIVVGGTGFYVQALVHGLPTAPKADRSVQAAIAAEFERSGEEALLCELAAVAPEDAARVRGNPRRVVRAVEVLRRTGRPPSAFPTQTPRYRYAVAVVLPPTETLRRRIEARTLAMIAGGWLDEVRRLAPGMHGWATARQAIGYEALRRVLTGEMREEDAVAGIRQATLRYAKRQRTWLRHRPASALRWHGTIEEHEPALKAWLAAVLAAWPGLGQRSESAGGT